MQLYEFACTFAFEGKKTSAYFMSLKKRTKKNILFFIKLFYSNHKSNRRHIRLFNTWINQLVISRKVYYATVLWRYITLVFSDGKNFYFIL